VINFGDVVACNADLIWLKLNPLKPALPQIDWLKKYYDQHFVVMSNIPNFKEAMDSINAGARAYINTHAGPNNLQQVVRVIEDHGIWLGEDLMQMLVGKIAGQVTQNSKANTQNDWQKKLSSREIDVVNAVVKGLPNKLIARELNITERTVKAHLTAVFEKLQVSDRIKLVLFVTSDKV
jgi:DNA-binding NarL/FixJ family response regulator